MKILNLQEIETTLREVQANYQVVRDQVPSRKNDELPDIVLENMLLAYDYLNHLYQEQVDIFSKGGLAEMLRLNTIVLYGDNEDSKKEYSLHLERTFDRFYWGKDEDFRLGHGTIDFVLKWNRKHIQDTVWKRAAGVYISVLSQPQVFVEGNHRTGSLIASYILLHNKKPPFVLSLDNAVQYFDPSHAIKYSDKRNLLYGTTDIGKLNGLKKAFGIFLQDSVYKRHLTKVHGSQS